MLAMVPRVTAAAATGLITLRAPPLAMRGDYRAAPAAA
jgi:hypothetical protein